MRNILEINLKIRPKNGIFPNSANNAAGTFDNLDKNKSTISAITNFFKITSPLLKLCILIVIHCICCFAKALHLNSNSLHSFLQQIAIQRFAYDLQALHSTP